MNKVWIFSLATILCNLILLTCQQPCTHSPQKWRQLLTGSWESYSLKIQLKSFENGKKDSLTYARPDNWADIFQLKPVIFNLHPDTSFDMEILDLNDSLIAKPTGFWEVFGDSLVVHERLWSNTYKLQLTNDTLRLSGLVDWDRDDRRDDLFEAVYLRK